MHGPVEALPDAPTRPRPVRARPARRGRPCAPRTACRPTSSTADGSASPSTTTVVTAGSCTPKTSPRTPDASA
ncbi:hypothetical protein BJF79_29150 [Actinomadura sp. CNU-125]|nr:hypothetical protein BJF79_29150 [Actinomadura sp. CNU-125]